MLWPYAYIAIETTQSFFLLLSGYLVLGRDTLRSKRMTIAIAACAAVTQTAKASGLFLVPAVAYLIFHYCRKTGEAENQSRRAAIDWLRLTAVTTVIIAVVAVNYYLEMHSATFIKLGRATGLYQKTKSSPILLLLNMFSLFASENKGLFIYCPVLITAFIALPVAWRENRGIVIFALAGFRRHRGRRFDDLLVR